MIDRVTGMLEAASANAVLGSLVYSLKCKPTQRMF